ncbi:MAG TPA: hypothetical protein DEA97_12270 [Bacteroidales bacterium]|nr:MAG: Methionyl-tRNA synthetase [candidate division TM6 bacterium GW2011_GWF2_33_332]HBS87327.1 hypothetical protein [Bacteroidales bacterium]
MKIKITFLILIIISCNLFSQLTQFTQIDNLPFKRVSKIKGVSDSEGNVCLYYSVYSFSNYAIIDNKGKIIKINKFKEYEGYILWGIIADDSFFYVFTNTENINEVEQLKISKKDGSFSSKKILLSNDKKEKIVANFSSGNKLYMLSIRNEPEKLILTTLTSKEEIFSKEIENNIPNLYIRFNKSLLKFYSEAYENTMANGCYRQKIYLRGDSILMTFDGYDYEKRKSTNWTEIITINLTEYTSGYRKISPDTLFRREKTNSFLLHDKLFKVRFANQIFDLSIYNLDDLSLIKQYAIHPKDSFNLVDDYIYFGFQNYFKIEKNLLDTTQKVLDFFNDGSYPFVLARKIDESKIKLRIGLTDAEEPFIMEPSLPTMTNSVIFSANFIDEGDFPPLEKSRFFETTLSYPGFEKIGKSDTKINLIENYNELLEKVDHNSGMRTLYFHPDGIHFAYMDKKEKALKIFLIINY